MKYIVLAGLLVTSAVFAQETKDSVPVKESIALQIRTAQLAISRAQTQEQNLVAQYKDLAASINQQSSAIQTLEANVCPVGFVLDDAALVCNKKPVDTPPVKK